MLIRPPVATFTTGTPEQQTAALRSFLIDIALTVPPEQRKSIINETLTALNSAARHTDELSAEHGQIEVTPRSKNVSSISISSSFTLREAYEDFFAIP